jgi:hypothetical protein
MGFIAGFCPSLFVFWATDFYSSFFGIQKDEFGEDSFNQSSHYPHQSSRAIIFFSTEFLINIQSKENYMKLS